MNINPNLSKLNNLTSSKIASNGRQYDLTTIMAVWEKAEKEFGFIFFKRDDFGEVIAKHDYGNKTQYGWEIVHILPLSQGGTDKIENLQPVHWKNVHKKGEQ